jgi:hypothetical protein
MNKNIYNRIKMVILGALKMCGLIVSGFVKRINIVVMHCENKLVVL